MSIKTLLSSFGTLLILFAIIGTGQAQNMMITGMNSSSFCAGSTIEVDYSTSLLLPGNTLTLELSDDAGDFTNPEVLASVSSIDSIGTISAVLPLALSSGTGYEIRILSSDPADTSATENILVYGVSAAEITGSSTICLGDSIELTASLGSEYMWNTGDTTESIWVSAAGDYYVTVTDSNGCSSTSPDKTVDTVQVPSVSISSDGPTLYCAGDTFEITLTASTSADSIIWFPTGANTPSIQISSGGNYSVIVTDSNFCTASSEISVDVISVSPTITPNGNTEYCEGSTFTLDLTASSAEAYVWNTGDTTQSISISQTGFYTVEVTDENGCTGISDSLEISNHPNPEVKLDLGMTNASTWFAKLDTVCRDFNGTLAGGYPTGGTFSGPGVDTLGNFSSEVAGLGSKTITYSYTDTNNCINTAEGKVYVDVCLGVYAYKSELQINAFPNPAKERINLNWKREAGFNAVSISDFSGRTVETIHIKDLTEKTISLEDYTPGIYFVRFSGEKAVIDFKFIKQ